MKFAKNFLFYTMTHVSEIIIHYIYIYIHIYIYIYIYIYIIFYDEKNNPNNPGQTTLALITGAQIYKH